MANLFINACVRKESSRTLIIAKKIMEDMELDYTEIDLPEEFKGNEDYDNTITITIDMINDHKTSLKYNIKNEN